MKDVSTKILRSLNKLWSKNYATIRKELDNNMLQFTEDIIEDQIYINIVPNGDSIIWGAYEKH